MANEHRTKLEVPKRRSSNRKLKATSLAATPRSTSALLPLLSAIAAQAPTFIGICDANFKPVFLNAAGRALIGLTSDADISSYQIADFFTDEYRTIINDAALPALAREGRWEGELRFRNFIDPTRQMDVSWLAFALYDEGGRFIGGATITNDNSARKQAEKDLRESRAQLASILAQLPLGVGVYDKDGKLLQANDQLRTHFGSEALPSGDPEAAKHWLGISSDGQRLALNQYPGARALRGDLISPGNDFLYTDEDGAERWVRVSAAPFRDEHGTIAGAVVVMADIDEEKRAAEKLVRSEARLQAAADLVGLSPYAWNPRTGVLQWDAKLKAMWGLPPDAHVDKDFAFTALHPEDVPRIEAAIARWLDPKGGVDRLEYRVRGFDGVERWVATHGQTIFDAELRPIDFIGVALDITERKQAEEALRENEDRLRKFAEYSSNVLWILDVESMTFEYVSRAFEQVWGKALEVTPRNVAHWRESIHADDRDRAMDWLERACQGETAVMKYRIVRSDGAVRLVRDTSFPIGDENGQVRRIGGVAQDITGHRGSAVYLVDPDEASRANLTLLLQGVGYSVKGFASASTFLEVAPVLAAGCVVVDIRSAQSKGLLIPNEVKTRRNGLPVVVIGDARGDVRFGSAVIKAGAVEFLPVPYGDEQILGIVASTLAGIQAEADDVRATQAARAHVVDMTPREREVLDGLLAGKTNKEIARHIEISPRTVEVHRARVMQRLGARTLPELVLMATAAGLGPLSSFHDDPSVR